ncbi:MAG: helix-turn-helix domain-containing protein [Moraxellaceae bacterium]|nr:helix-turn-helix domain-containing protein [Moraxellaceae bacterium]
MEINNTNTNSTDVVTAPETVVMKGEFGKLLRDARNEKELSIEKISEDTYIKGRQLIALEEEDFDSLPQMTFVKGFALKYARYLQLDEKEVLEKFYAVYPENLKVKSVDDIDFPMTTMGKIQRGGHRNFSVNPILLLACIGVFAFAIFLIYIVSSAEEEQNQPNVVEEGIVNSNEQQQGASLDDVGSSGSVINLTNKKQDDKDTEDNK